MYVVCMLFDMQKPCFDVLSNSCRLDLWSTDTTLLAQASQQYFPSLKLNALLGNKRLYAPICNMKPSL